MLQDSTEFLLICTFLLCQRIIMNLDLRCMVWKSTVLDYKTEELLF